MSELYKEAKLKAVEYLSRREYSCFELSSKLRQRQYPEEVIASVVEDLRAANYLNDERYANMILRSGFDRGQGPAKIRYKLQQNGVNSALIASTFEASDYDWFALACNVRERKFGELDVLQTYKKETFFKERARQQRFLAGRGFTIDQIHYALESDSS